VVHFITAYASQRAVTTLLMYLQINLLQFNYVASFFIAASLSTLMNFLLTKFAVFEREGFLPVSPAKQPGYA
jgi:putative flippase GtrA